VSADDLVGSRLILAKAKAFGIHTGMYELLNLSSFRGRSLQFLWQRDDDKDGPVAGFFRDLGNGINTVADAAANVVETVVETVAEAVSTVIEAIGLQSRTFSMRLETFSGRSVGWGLLRGAFHWVATVVSAVFDLVATVIKGVLIS